MGMLDIETLILITVVIFLALPVHEFAHAWVAHKLGDDTAERMGRLTLNPFKHLDLFGTLMMYVAHFGWAKPVPINPMNFKKRRLGIVLTSIAGPVSNLIMAFLSALGLGLIQKLILTGTLSADSDVTVTVVGALIDLFQMLLTINILLAVFNMLPIPPLDGSRLISVLLPDRYQMKLAAMERYIAFGFLFIAIILPRLTGQPSFISTFLSGLIGPVANGMMSVVFLIFGI